MKVKFIRAVAILISLMMIGGILTSCENVTMPSESAEVSEGKPEEEHVEQLPHTQQYAGTEFTVAIPEKKEYIFSEEESISIVNTAVSERNKLITDKYGVSLDVKTVNSEEILDKMQKAAEAGTKYADMVCFPGNTLVTLSDNGLIYNLLSSDNFNIESKYINTSAVKSVTANNSLYMLFDSTSQYYDNAWVVFYDKGIIEELKLQDPYILASEGKWTWAKLLEYSEVAADKVLKKGSPDLAKDIFGYGSQYNEDELPLVMWESCGIPIFGDTYKKPVAVNADLTEVNETVAMLDKIYSSKSRYILEHTEAENAFSEGRLAFFIYKLEYAAAIADSEREWGILPLPKKDNTQENYCTFIDPAAYALAIPANGVDEEKSITILNAFCAASGEAVKKAVYDKYVNLFFRNNESTIMLKTIFDTGYFDMAAIYGSAMDEVAATSTNIIRDAIIKNNPINTSISKRKASFARFSKEKFK